MCISNRKYHLKRRLKTGRTLSFTMLIASYLREILEMWAGVFVLGRKGLEEICEVLFTEGNCNLFMDSVTQ